MSLHVDFETRSAADIKKTGAHAYAEHHTTDVWCMAYAFGEEDVELWTPGQEMPTRLREHVEAGGIITAHNAAFERAIWRHVMQERYGWPAVEVEQWRCTMAMALAMSLPGSLDGAAAALGLDVQKDQAGYRIMLSMARPRRTAESGKLIWWDVPERMERLFAYCKQDVIVERELERRLLALRPAEQELWFIDQKINDRGVYVDQELCVKAMKIVAEATERLDREMATLTDYEVTACSNTNQVTAYLRERGLEVDSIAKGELDELINNAPDETTKRVLELRREAAKASVAKIKTLMAGISANGRAKGLLQFHAASTGRWAGRRFQPQNLKRPELNDAEIDGAIDTVLSGDVDMVEMLYGPPLSVVGDCIRGMITAAPGHSLVAADFNAIEARVLAWLAGQKDVLDLFRRDEDVYLHAASRIFGRPVTKADKYERQIGKVAVLALGYQGGKGAFAKMAAAYGMKVEESEAEAIKTAWRTANDAIVRFWWQLEEKAIEAIEAPGKTIQCGKVRFKKAGSFLFLQLPSGRALSYPYPRVIEKEVPWGGTKPAMTYRGVDSYTRKWGDCDAYGGLLAENVTQAVARDFMAEAIKRLEAQNYPVILTVHDEVVSEVLSENADPYRFGNIMEMAPDWAPDCPIKAEAWAGCRYRK